MEPNKKLSIALQADYLRSQLHALLPQPTTKLSTEAFLQTAQQQINETLLKTLLTQIAKMKQLVEEAHQTKQSPLSDAVTVEVSCQST